MEQVISLIVNFFINPIHEKRKTSSEINLEFCKQDKLQQVFNPK